MKHFFEILTDPWTIFSNVVVFIVTFVLTFKTQKHLTRYKEYISHLHHDLDLIRDLCKRACIDASSLKPCLYKETGGLIRPTEELHQAVEYPIFRDKRLLKKLRKFLRQVDRQRNIFSWGNGSTEIHVGYSSGEKIYHYIVREGKDASPLPNISNEERERLLHLEAEQLHEIFGSIDRRIEKLLK